MSKSDDTISRQAAIDVVKRLMGDYELSRTTQTGLQILPSAQPTEASCWGCNCQKMERLKEQKTFSEMVHLHDAETHEERTKTHSCDCIERQAALDWMKNEWNGMVTSLFDGIKALPSAQHDMSEYSDKLWKKAYERGKAEALDEIIHCKDCKHWSRESICDGFCSEDCMRHDEDFYCGYAERKNNE